MKEKILLITDSNSGLTQEEGKALGVFIIPMPFIIEGKEYLEEITLSQEEFYLMLENKNINISTAQPSVYYLEELFKEKLNSYEEILYIPMSSGLSGTCHSAIALARKYMDKVYVVDNLRISITLKESINEAIKLIEKGYNAKKIKEYLEETKLKSSVYIFLDTLEYLKRGGRISPRAAKIGTMFNIKPILSTKGGLLEKFALCRTSAQAKLKMMNQIEKELKTVFKEEYENNKMTISVAHTKNDIEAKKFKEELMKRFPRLTFHFVDRLSLSVSCHIGPKALAVAITINSYLE